MLSAEKLETALASCEQEVYWKPAHVRGILVVPLLDEGASGGVEVPSFRARHTFQGLVVAVHETRWVKVGDLINFDMGRGESVYTLLGESFFSITEKNCSAIDDELLAPTQPKEQLLASGLWVVT